VEFPLYPVAGQDERSTLCITIVDDSPDDRAAVCALLSDAGLKFGVRLQYRQAATGHDGLASCRREAPDCLVLDHSLPDMNGLDFLAHLRRDPGDVLFPVVMLTGSADPGLTSAALRSGAQEYLPKRLMEPEMLLRAVQSARDRFALMVERRDAEASLQAAADSRAAADARLAALVNDAPAILVQSEQTPDGAWHIRYVSSNALRTIGYTPDQIVNTGWSLLLDADGLAIRARGIAEAIQKGVSEAEMWFRHAGGHDMRMRASIRAARIAGDHWRFTSNLVDLTPLHAANAARATVQARLDYQVREGPGVLFQDRRIGGVWSRIYVSAAASRVIGYPASISTGPLPAMIRAADAVGETAWAAAVKTATETGEASFEYAMRHGAGHLVRLRANLKSRCFDDGDVLLTGYLVDVSAEWAAALDTARADLEQAIAMGPGWLYRVTIFPGGQIRLDYLSDNALSILGYTKTEMADPGWLFSVLDPAQVPAVFAAMEQLRRLQPVANEYRIRIKSGAWIWISDTLRPDRAIDADGSLKVVGYASDITEMKDRAAQLQQAARLSLLGEMAAGVAHELRQPLTAISFAAQNAAAALEQGDTGNVRFRLGRIVSQTERADRIIENLRLFGRGAEEQEDLIRVPLDSLVAGTLDFIGQILRMDGIEVVAAPGLAGHAVLGHQARLEQVLVNLLLNARDALLDHKPRGGRRVVIDAYRPDGGPVVTLTVADNGGGIPAGMLPRLFQPFTTTKPADKGTGLGLSICHGLIRKMGGNITAGNEAEGAVFTIMLPTAV
jgi:PAS domain S-box-containing protein